VSVINADTDKYLTEAKTLDANSPSVKDHPSFQELFAREIPSQVDGFECPDKDKMALVWPAGTDTAREVRLTVQWRARILCRERRCYAAFSARSLGPLI
jgi:hypothetical protein